MDIVKPNKTGMYQFQWRVIFEDGLYQLQRFSKAYRTWMTVQSSFDENEIVKLYNQIEA